LVFVLLCDLCVTGGRQKLTDNLKLTTAMEKFPDPEK